MINFVIYVKAITKIYSFKKEHKFYTKMATSKVSFKHQMSICLKMHENGLQKAITRVIT